MTWMLAALMGVFATACSNDDNVAGTDGDQSRAITFTVNSERNTQTRATENPGKIEGKVLRYIMEVYDKETSTLVENSKQVKTVADPSASSEVAFTMEKPEDGKEYTVVFWADYVAEAGTDDLYYDTSAGLDAVTFKDATPADLDGEAFYKTVAIRVDGTPETNRVLLKHSVAQVNIKTMDELVGYKSVKVTYGDAANANAPMSVFNALDGTVATGLTIADVVSNIGDTSGATEMDAKTFHTFYVFAPKATQGLINMTISLCTGVDGASPTKDKQVSDVPLQANYRTNIIGAFNTILNTFIVSCDATWENPDNNKYVTTPSVSVWDGSIPAANDEYAFGGGDGSSEDPYLIKSAADLAQLAANVNNKNYYSGKYFQQEVDINLNNKAWMPIGTSSSKSFNGSFNGNHKWINNLNVNVSTGHAGLFGSVGGVGNDKTLENIHVFGTVVNSAPSGSPYAGGIIGECQDLGNGNITNCSFSGTVSCPNGFAGGIVGAQIYDVSGCKNEGAVSGKVVGGIIGYGCDTYAAGSNYKITNSYNTGTVTATDKAGGIVGHYLQTRGGSNTMNNCYNTGTISGTASAIGALAGAAGDYLKAVSCFVKESYTYTVTGDETVFGSSAWPTWGAETWNLGSWNSGTPTYPTLVWEADFEAPTKVE